MNLLLRIVAVVAGVLAALVALAFIGLQVRPRPFAPYPDTTPDLPTAPVRQDLPAPVARFFQLALGDQAPLIESTVLTGRGSIRLNGLRFPARYRFAHIAGQGYKHYMEATVWGFPLFKVNEFYLDGHARMELPVGVIENSPKTDLAANLALWGESTALPALYVTDPRVKWEPIDETHANLIIPAGEETDSFIATFNAETGMLQSLEAKRWKSPEAPAKLGWRIDLSGWRSYGGMLVPTGWALTWEDETGPWFTGTLEEVLYNVDVDEYVRARGA